jgi:hypothetical protein
MEPMFLELLKLGFITNTNFKNTKSQKKNLKKKSSKNKSQKTNNKSQKTKQNFISGTLG